MKTTFELFYNQEVHAYGAVVRREGMEVQTAHHFGQAQLKTWLATFGFWPSISIQKIALEAGARISIVLPCSTETIEDIKAPKGDF